MIEQNLASPKQGKSRSKFSAIKSILNGVIICTIVLTITNHVNSNKTLCIHVHP